MKAEWNEAQRILFVIPTLGQIIVLPFFGRLLDKTNVIVVASLAYLLLAIWPFFLAISVEISTVYIATIFFGLGMAGVHVAWMLGAMTFAKEEDIHSYMAVHVTLVGVRALFAPFLGLLLNQYIGFSATFLTASALLVIASILMLTLHRRFSSERKTNQ